MPKLYLCEARDGSRALTATPQANGNAGLTHLLATVSGTIRGYSGSVNGTTVVYWVDNGPGRGIERSAT